MKVVRTLELARAGRWGQDGAAITREDLAEVAETFTARRPLTIGHVPPDGKEGPRYGQALNVRLAENGNLLVGDVEFGDEANRLYTGGLYDGWSVSIPRRAADGKRYLHHLALLGATPPKIPGLKEIESASYEYADGDNIKTLSFGGAIKTQGEPRVTEKEAAELAERNKKLEEENKKLLDEKKAKEELEAAAKAEGEKKKDGETAAATEETGGAGDSGAEGGKDFSDRLAKMEAEVRKSRVEALMAKVGQRLPQGLRDKVRGLANQLAGEDEAFNFSDNGKTTSAKAVDLLGEVLAQWPAPVKLGTSGFDYSDTEEGGGAKPVDWGKVAKGM
jgi:hypothetical protein